MLGDHRRGEIEDVTRVGETGTMKERGEAAGLDGGWKTWVWHKEGVHGRSDLASPGAIRRDCRARAS
jgi:hypothetical protein